MEVVSMEDDYVWIHDYHLMALPLLLRMKFKLIRCGLFLHSPFPSSEIFRSFPKREEILRSMLNADLIGHSPLGAPARGQAMAWQGDHK
jgi:trehalose 6-phosphate synthase/phosphatase